MIASLILIGTRITPFFLQTTQPLPDSQPPGLLDQQIALEAVSHGPMNVLTGILVPLGLFAMIFGIIWLRWRQQQALYQTRAEFHKQLLDKFATGRDFAEFLESKGSQRFLEELWSQGTQPKEKTLRNGIVVAMLGLSMLALTWVEKDFVIPGVMLVAVGAGFLIAFAISRRLSKSRNLANDPGPGNLPASQN
jgi:multisubunit Na+/H+ antiporter MnhB subunit